MTKFNVGDEVMVAPEVKRPHFGWGDIKPGDIGVVKWCVNKTVMYIDFPKHRGWKGTAHEMILASLENE